MTRLIALLAIAIMAAGCSAGFAVRSPDRYRDDTRAVLSARDSQIESCYNVALANDPSLSGDVTVKFTVAEDTGEFSETSVVEEETTAPAVLQQCVLRALQDLELQPPDENKGVATFTYSFETPQQG